MGRRDCITPPFEGPHCGQKKAPPPTAYPRSGNRRTLGCPALGPPLLAHAPEDALATVLFQSRVKAADLDQDLVGYCLLLLAGGILDRLPANRISVLNCHLRKLQPLPVAHPRGAVDGD